MEAFAEGLPHLGTEAVVEPGQQAVAGPLAEMMIDRLPRRKVFGQEPPLGTGFDQIENGVDDRAQGGAWAAAFLAAGRKRRSRCHWSWVRSVSQVAIFIA